MAKLLAKLLRPFQCELSYGKRSALLHFHRECAPCVVDARSMLLSHIVPSTSAACAGDIGRCTQVAEQALANNSRPNGRGQFAWRVGQAQPAAAAAAPAPADAAPRRPVLDLSDYLEVDVDLGVRDSISTSAHPAQPHIPR